MWRPAGYMIHGFTRACLSIAMTGENTGLRHLPAKVFQRCVLRYGGHHKGKGVNCKGQFLCIAFAHLAYREGLLVSPGNGVDPLDCAAVTTGASQSLLF